MTAITAELTTAEARRLIPHLARAQDERAIRDRGPLAAIMAAPSEDTMVRRAALVLFREDVTPDQVLTALSMGSLLQRPATR